MPRLDLSQRELRIVSHIVGSALDQAHDYRQQGDEDYLEWLVDHEAGETVVEVESDLSAVFERMQEAL